LPEAAPNLLVAQSCEGKLAIFCPEFSSGKTGDHSGQCLFEAFGSEAVLKRLGSIDEENGDIKTEARKQFRIVLNIYFLEHKELITAGDRNFALHHLAQVTARLCVENDLSFHRSSKEQHLSASIRAAGDVRQALACRNSGDKLKFVGHLFQTAPLAVVLNPLANSVTVEV
jgi:hypothetical protein